MPNKGLNKINIKIRIYLRYAFTFSLMSRPVSYLTSLAAVICKTLFTVFSRLGGTNNAFFQLILKFIVRIYVQSLQKL